MTLSRVQFGYDTHPSMQRARDAFGSNDIETIFPRGAGQVTVPWPEASRLKTRDRYDKSVVHEVLSREPKIEEFDPRNLHATQRSITRSGVDYYMGGQYDRTGQTFADMHQAGNRWPVIYERQDDGQNLILSGHHRATAALLQGQPLRARRVSGPWGPAQGSR